MSKLAKKLWVLPVSNLNEIMQLHTILMEPCNHAFKKTIKNTVQKDTQTNDAQIKTEKLNIILDNIEILVPFIFQIIFYQ